MMMSRVVGRDGGGQNLKQCQDYGLGIRIGLWVRIRDYDWG